jgi:hypothetical protein
MTIVTEEEYLRRFWSKVVKTDNGCWIWVGGHTKQGYGRFHDGIRKVLTHRYLYEKCIGKIPEGLCLLHSCDTPNCVNPEHLHPGTTKDNFYEAVLRGKWSHEMLIGKVGPHYKLSEDVRSEVRRKYDGKYGSIKRLAGEYGVSSKIIKGCLEETKTCA